MAEDSFTTNLDPANVLLVDAMNIAFRWKHKKTYVFAQEYISTVKSLARSYKCGTIIVAADKGSSVFRKNIYPEYKGHRKEKYANQTEEEKEFIKNFFLEYENTLKKMEEDPKIIVLRYDGIEADDIAAYIVANKNRYLYEKIWLISSDKDWDLLISDDVSRFSTVSRKEITSITWPYEVPIDDYISYKVLIGGDDNIKGIMGIGPKTAAKLIAQYGSAYDIYQSLPLPGKSKYIQNLNESGDLILLNYELMDLLTTYPEVLGKDVITDIHKRLVTCE